MRRLCCFTRSWGAFLGVGGDPLKEDFNVEDDHRHSNMWTYSRLRDEKNISTTTTKIVYHRFLLEKKNSFTRFQKAILVSGGRLFLRWEVPTENCH